ncbi:Cis,cis-muconate transport protein [Intoshia linei]|uniref:Cis,cis-muconate transport protein n=1 Tax=Intoshia linei TaxID=1819745 RepID=A0A177AZD6_9BILA|nr:Cis,cis-muconate transport protein [Intoshia linei]
MNITSPDDIEYNVEQAIEHIGFGRFQIQLLLICGLFAATDAMEMLLLAVLSPVLRCEFKLSQVEVACITTVVFVGMFSGSFIWGHVSDKYGRLITMFLASIWIFYFGICVAFSPSYYWVLFLRGSVGFAFGGAIQAFTLISEYLPMKYRAKVLIIYCVLGTCGSIFELGISALIIPRYGWRVLVAVSALPTCISTLCIWTLPESARYLVTIGKHNQAYNVLNYIAQKNGKTLPSRRLISTMKLEKPNVFVIFSRKFLRLNIQLWICWLYVAFSHYGLILSQSEILEFSHHLKDDVSEMTAKAVCNCNLFKTSDYVSMILSTLGEFLVIPFNLCLVDSIGRKYTIMLNFIISSICFFLIIVSKSKIMLTLVCFANRAIISTIFNCIYIYTVESQTIVGYLFKSVKKSLKDIYPTTIRSSALGICSSMARIGAIITPFVAQVLLNYSLTAAMVLYGSLSLVCAVNSLLLKSETSGQGLRQDI